jgi:hypothetical protein
VPLSRPLYAPLGQRGFGWFAVNGAQPVAFSQLTAAPLANGNLAAFGLGSDQHAYEATFDTTTGAKLTGWSQLSAMTFARLSAAGQSVGKVRYKRELHAGTQAAANKQTFSARLTVNGTLMDGWAPLPAGAIWHSSRSD